MEAKERVIVALDVDNVQKATALVEELSPYVGYFKIGLELINFMLASLITSKDWLEAMENLLSILRLFRLLEGKILWDGKFDDIPNTVGRASLALSRLDVKMFNVHASAGRKSVEAAVTNKGNSFVLGVTVLTSIDEEECISIFGDRPGPKVLQFARMLSEVGANGIICSPQELVFLSEQPELDRLLKVTPGVRPGWAAVGDQKRVMTPAEAIRAGASYLVIDRPITQPPAEIGSPVKAAKLIVEEIAEAIKERNG